jgi:Winged helix DNA-binding domain
MVLAERLTSQLLSGNSAAGPEEVTKHLLAVQAQDARGARLAIRVRTSGLTAADVDRALDDRSLVIGWLNRGTLHLVAADDYPWLHALTTPQLFTANARRLEQEGVSPAEAERAVAVIERSLAEEGPLTRSRLRERIASTGVRTEGQALVHLLLLASLRGVTVRGPMVGGEQAFAHAEDWLGPPAPVDRDRALAELARRYLAGHAPADDRDLAKWAGIPLGAARAGLQAIAAELHTRPDGLVELKATPTRADPLPPPRLIGQFDPILLGWASRADIVGAHTGIVTNNGIFRPFAMVEGRAAGIWSRRAGKIELEPFHELSGEVRAALDADAADVTRFFS